MRKVKPRKKHEVKYNEPKQYIKPPLEQEHTIEFALHLSNIVTIIEKHLIIWNNEAIKNCPLLPFYLSNLSKATELVKKVKNKIGDVQMEVNPYTKLIFANVMVLCEGAIGDPLPLTPDDIEQKLPAGFMGTLGALARVVTALLNKKLEYIALKFGVIEAVVKIGDYIEKYLAWIAKDIVDSEKIISKKQMSEKEKARKLAKLYQAIDIGLEDEKIKQEKEFNLEEETMKKTDKEMIKKVISDDEALKEAFDDVREELKEEKKKAGRPKKVKIEEVVEDAVVEKIDNVNSPSHYQLAGVESIDIIRGLLGTQGILAFYVGNAFKYLIRAEKKNGLEDYKKARKYLEWIVENGNSIKTDDINQVLLNLNTNWLNISIALLSNMKGAKALLLNSVFNNFFKGNYKAALDELNMMIGE